MNKQNIVYTYNGILLGMPSTTWVDLENILNERNETQRPHVCAYIYKMSRTGKCVETK